jgi:hypothetical protein
VISERPAHPALVSEPDFLAVQQVTAIPAPKDQGVRRYLLTGLVICAVCGRRMDAHWVHGRPGYRCRPGYSSARSSAPRARNVYGAEQRIIDGLLCQLSYTGELPFLADTSELLDHLRKPRVVVVCGVDTLDVEPVDLGKQVTPTTIITRMDDSGGG